MPSVHEFDGNPVNEAPAYEFDVAGAAADVEDEDGVNGVKMS